VNINGANGILIFLCVRRKLSAAKAIAKSPPRIQAMVRPSNHLVKLDVQIEMTQKSLRSPAPIFP